LTEEREFFSLPLAVSPSVLIPRAETELLVELTLAALASAARPAVLDVGTGSGAIALAIKRARGDAVVTATDRSAAALAVARANAARLSLDVRFIESHWFEALGGEAFDVVVSNPPYVRSADVAGALAFEPRLALDGGTDGLDAYRSLFAAAAAHLDPRRGMLLVEHGAEQRPELDSLAQAHGWRVAAARPAQARRSSRAGGPRRPPRRRASPRRSPPRRTVPPSAARRTGRSSRSSAGRRTASPRGRP
jgi:release factor glutamine methyltransferase